MLSSEFTDELASRCASRGSMVASSPKNTSDGFVGHAVIGGHLAQGVVVFNDTAYYVRPFFQWDA